MKTKSKIVLAGGVGVALMGSATLPAMADTNVAGGAPANRTAAVAAPAEKDSTLQRDDLPSIKSDAQRALRRDAVEALVAGEAKVVTINGSQVIKLEGGKSLAGGKATKDRYVEYDASRKANILTILVEFGDQTKDLTGGTPGPLHNQIAQPDRTWNGDATDDNSTYWVENFDRRHYLDLMFGEKESFKDFYKKQSQGRFAVGGDVSDWVKVPYNEATYGSNKIKGSEGYWPFIQDTAKAWYDAQVAAGKTPEQIKASLAQFDVWDRYDFDGDGNFDEPDGYIDHFQAIHAGEGEEAGGGAQGEDAIWSHRWSAFGNLYGKVGPENNKAGGVPVGDSGLWILDYTTEPENGGLGVFVHEFGHDLGLPDLYDTTNRASNGTAYWSLMSSGSWLDHNPAHNGNSPGYLGPWEKQQLGWLDFATTTVGRDGTYRLGAAARDEVKNKQALAVALPDQQITDQYIKPFAGAKEWWSTTGDNTDATLTRSIDLTSAKTASVSAQLAYDTEQDYDFYTAELSTDGGKTWKPVAPAVSGSAMQWKPVTYDLTAYVGQKIDFRFHYLSDGGVNGQGVFLDEITVTVDGTVVSTDGAEGASEWVASGFKAMDGTDTYTRPHYYLVENRRYVDYDANLKTGPYNFGWYPKDEKNPQPGDKPNWVERFPYMQGMLVWYVNGAYKNNNVSEHPGYGQVLPVDSHPAPLMWDATTPMGNKFQTYDAPFSDTPSFPMTVHRNGVATHVRMGAPNPVFHDASTTSYYRDAPGGIKYNSTKTAGSGVKVQMATTPTGEILAKVTYKK